MVTGLVLHLHYNIKLHTALRKIYTSIAIPLDFNRNDVERKTAMDSRERDSEEASYNIERSVVQVLRVNPDCQLAVVNNTIKDRASIDDARFSSIQHSVILKTESYEETDTVRLLCTLFEEMEVGADYF